MMSCDGLRRLEVNELSSVLFTFSRRIKLKYLTVHLTTVKGQLQGTTNFKEQLTNFKKQLLRQTKTLRQSKTFGGNKMKRDGLHIPGMGRMPYMPGVSDLYDENDAKDPGIQAEERMGEKRKPYTGKPLEIEGERIEKGKVDSHNQENDQGHADRGNGTIACNGYESYGQPF